MVRRRLGIESLDFWVLVLVWSPKVRGQGPAALGSPVSPCFAMITETAARQCWADGEGLLL